MQLVCTRPTCNPGQTSLTYDRNYELINFKMMKTILKSFFVLLGMLMSQVAWAAFQYETTTYDFLTAANTQGNQLNMSENQYSDIDGAFYGATLIYDDKTVDISKFAFKSGYSNRGWWLRGNNSGGEGLKPQKEGGLEFAICDLHAGDKVIIKYLGLSCKSLWMT